MAQVSTELHEHIDYILDHLIQLWQDLPRVEKEIGQWDLVEQIDYVEEWTPREELRRKLERYAAKGLLGKSQLERYAKLQRLVSENEAILARLRNS